MSRFNELLNGYLQDSLSESELAEFFALVEGNSALLDEQLIRESGFEEKHTGFTDGKRREKMLSNIRMQAKTAEHRQAQTTKFKQASAMEYKIVRLRRWLAAAAVLILLIGGGIFLAVRKEHNVPLVKARSFKNDVAPGTNGAVLQLADGSKITLDSIGNGMVTQQGNTQVVKQAGGGVAYLIRGNNDPAHGSNDPAQGSNGLAQAGNNPEILRNTLSTGKGKQFQITLPDGTKVWLNSSSSLSYPTSFNGGKQRLVEMTGEAYFEVAHNAAKPFVVRTDKEDVTVLGTHFNINSYEDEPALKTTLLEGSVSVSNSSGKVRIVPGQQAAVFRNRAGMDRISVGEANVEDAIAWKNGVFNFDNADIRTVMRQLARWYDVEVKYSGPIPDWQDFKGEIGRNLSLAQVLKVLEQARVHFRIEEDKRIVIFQ